VVILVIKLSFGKKWFTQPVLGLLLFFATGSRNPDSRTAILDNLIKKYRNKLIIQISAIPLGGFKE